MRGLAFSVAFVVVVLLGLWVETSQSLSCSCGAAPCEDPTCCPNSTQLVGDACGCCKVCAKADNDRCGGPWNIGGRCGAGLSCLRQCECKTVSDKECVFPFKLKGKSFDKCTTEESPNGKPRCAVTLDVTGEVIEGQMEECIDGCPGTSFECSKDDLFNKDGRCVVTSRAEIEANQRLPYSLDEELKDEGHSVPQCKETAEESKCKCVEELSENPQRGEGCEKGGRGQPGWCYLTNLADPSDPTKDCFWDATWSKSKGKFWSSMACQGDADQNSGIVNGEPIGDGQSEEGQSQDGQSQEGQSEEETTTEPSTKPPPSGGETSKDEY